MIKKYLILLLFLGTVNMMYSQNNKEKKSDIEISDLNVELLNNMLSQFIEKHGSETEEYPVFFHIPQGTGIKKVIQVPSVNTDLGLYQRSPIGNG